MPEPVLAGRQEKGAVVRYLIAEDGAFCGIHDKPDVFSPSIKEPFTKDGAVYTLPACFSAPILSGAPESLKGISVLHSLAEKASELEKQLPESSPFIVMDPLELAEALKAAYYKD